MKTINHTFLFLLLSFQIFAQPIGYTYGKVVTINAAVVTGTANLTDFPFLLKVTDPDLRSLGNGGNVNSSLGYDIIFTDASCVVKLDHDVEKYNPATGELICWIKLPTLSYNLNTVIHMYYGNSTITVPTSTSQTWSNGFGSVLHLSDNPVATAPQMKDTSPGSNSGTCLGSMTTTNSVSGKIASAILFDEMDDAITISDFDYTQSFTISFWFHLSEVSGTAYQYMFSHGNFSTAHSSNIYFGEDNVSFVVERSMLKNIFQDVNDATSTAGLDATTTYVNGFWHYYSFVVGNSGGATVYVDGVQKAYLSILGGNAYDPASSIFLGARSDLNTSRFLGGMMDEFRIASEPRSYEWLATEYTNQNSPTTYYMIGSQLSALALCVVLPVELVTFTAKEKDSQVELNWETATEKNNDHFVVERCANGIDFKGIGRLPGAGTTSESHKYTYEDNEPLAGINYYRLKQVDFDGKYEYSKIIVNAFEEKDREVFLWPNPAEDKVTLEFSKNVLLLNEEVNVFDETGTLVYVHSVAGNKVEMNLGFLNKGFYYLRFKNPHLKSLKLILR